MAFLVMYSVAFGGWIFVQVKTKLFKFFKLYFQELQNIPKKVARTLSLPIWYNF